MDCMIKNYKQTTVEEHGDPVLFCTDVEGTEVSLSKPATLAVK